MTLKDLIVVIDGDTLLAVQDGFSDVFDGYPRDAEEEIPPKHLKREVKALYNSTIRKALVIEL